MNCQMSVVYVTTLAICTELDTDASFAIISWLSRASFCTIRVLQMFQDSCVSIGMPIFVLHAILTNVREARTLSVFCCPSIVEAIPKAIDGFDNLLYASRRCSLDNLTSARIDDVYDGTDRRFWMSRAFFCAGLGCGGIEETALEFMRKIMVTTFGIWTYRRSD